MGPAPRKFALTAHVSASVGSLGALAAFLALALAGLTSQNLQVVRAATVAMELTAWFVVLPFILASLLTGLVSSLGTTWGLFRHYWIIVKFLMTIFAIVILLTYLLYRQTLSDLAGVAAEPIWSSDDLRALRNPSPFLHAAGGLIVLLVATVLGMYKPKGLTAYGARKDGRAVIANTPRWVRLMLGSVALALLCVAFLIGVGGHGPGDHTSRP